MQEMKNRSSDVARKFANGPVMLMNRATPQAVMVSPALWDEIIDRLEDLQDAVVTLKAELAVAVGQSRVETIDDPAAFMREMMGSHESLPARDHRQSKAADQTRAAGAVAGGRSCKKCFTCATIKDQPIANCNESCKDALG